MEEASSSKSSSSPNHPPHLEGKDKALDSSTNGNAAIKNKRNSEEGREGEFEQAKKSKPGNTCGTKDGNNGGQTSGKLSKRQRRILRKQELAGKTPGNKPGAADGNNGGQSSGKLSKRQRRILRAQELAQSGKTPGKKCGAGGGNIGGQSLKQLSKLERRVKRAQALYAQRQENQGGSEDASGGPKMSKRQQRRIRRLQVRYLKNATATVVLSAARKDHIQSLLNSPEVRQFIGDGVGYEHMADSTFKREFLSSISGRLDERLLPFSMVSTNDPSLDDRLYRELAEKRARDPTYRRWQEQRSRLPAHAKRREILQLIAQHQVVVLSGETGCGKTTQVPQFILDEHLENRRGSTCRVVCTQPRRISAIAVAERVAEERAERIGVSAGYSIRLERKPPRDRGSIFFCTAGIVLRQLVHDPSLKGVSHLILDEIHERDVTCDFLICILKQVIAIRKDLKVILMSATLNAESFSKYYNDAPHINIPGLTFPVDEYYLEDVIEGLKIDFIQSVSQGPSSKKDLNVQNPQLLAYIEELRNSGKYSDQTIKQLQHPMCEKLNITMVYELVALICEKNECDGAILVFMPGFMQISTLIGMMERSGRFPSHRFVIIPLHSMMATVNQRQVFERPPPGKRKIVVATNIAETSITIDDVVYVVDSGRIKMSNYDPDTNTQTLDEQWVSKANAAQRKGRAGRVQSGTCFYLFTRWRQEQMQEFPKPEVLRTRLANTMLQAKWLQVGEIRPFFAKLLDPPADKSVAVSLDLLARLGALDDEEKLTPLGYHLARLPMDPQIGKMLVLGAMLGCLDPIVSIAASLDFKDGFQMPMGKLQEAKAKRRELAEQDKSDHCLLHTALSRYEQASNRFAFCREYFLSPQVMGVLLKLKREFVQYLHEMRYVPSTNPRDPACNVNSDNVSLVKAVICAGLYPNVIVVRKPKRCTNLWAHGQYVKLHPKSIVHGPLVSPLLVYYQLMRSTANYVYDATMVHPLPVILFGDKFHKRPGFESADIMIGDMLMFRCTEDTADLIEELRQRLNLFLQYKISHPGVVDWRNETQDIKLLEAIKDLITSEDIGDVEQDACDDDEEQQPTGNEEEFLEPTESADLDYDDGIY